MRIVTTRESLLPAIQKIGNVVERRQTLPILSNMHVQLSGNRLILTATDLEVEVKTFGIVDGEGDGEFTLPARKFIDICRALPEKASIEIKHIGEKVVVSSEKCKFVLGSLPATDYPSIEIIAPDNSIVISESDLKGLIERASFSMAQQDVRYYLNGMLVEIDKNTLRAVATDGHRLALSEITLNSDFPDNIQILIPRKAVIELSRMLAFSDEEISIDISANLVRFNIKDTVFTTKLIDGKFPDYKGVIPKICDKRARINREVLKNALLRVSILSSEKYKGIRLTFDNGILHIQAHNPEQEEAEEELDIDYENQRLSMGFNVGYMLDILSSMSSDTVEIELANSNSSTLIKDPENTRTLYVVMPMRL